MPIDHVMIKVGSWEQAKKYYTTALKPLGYEEVADWGTGGGMLCMLALYHNHLEAAQCSC
jgi:catechol 2,3-dioxygenase-like lactoylglutathione lyase family enzyme